MHTADSKRKFFRTLMQAWQKKAFNQPKAASSSTALCIQLFKESTSTGTRNIWYMYRAAHWGFACMQEKRHQRTAELFWGQGTASPTCKPHNDLLCSHSPKMPKTAKLSQGPLPVAKERGHGLSHLSWQPSSHIPSPQPPAIARTARTVEQEGKPGATDPHEQSHAFALYLHHLGHKVPNKSRAVVI